MRRLTRDMLVLVLTWVSAAIAGEPVPSLAQSPRIAALRKDWDGGNRDCVARFWGERKTGPMVEPIPGDPGYSLVTFVWKAGAGVKNVAVITAMHSVRFAEGKMERLGESDLWYRTYRLRDDARLGYMFVESDAVDDWSKLNRQDWEKLESAMRPDPLNPLRFGTRSAGGFQESILELPNAPSRAWAERNCSVDTGTLADLKFKSEILNNERDLTVYTPAGYAKTGPPCGLLILFDREKYNSKDHVEAPVILDNLLAAKKIPPTVAVLVGNVDRGKELACHAPFAEFLASELVPWVRKEYGVTSEPSRVVVAGSSFGGLAASYAAFKHPEVFGNVLSQSGSYWWEAGEADEDEWLTRQFAANPPAPVRFSLEVGLHETWIPRQHAPTQVSANRHFRDVLKARGNTVHYSEFSSGHDYLNWRCTLPLGLIALIGTPAQGPKVAAPAPAASIDDLVRAELKGQRVPAIAVAVVKDGKVIKEEAYGLANVELNVPATPKTVFQSGSVGKQFTAMAAMLLIEAGKLNADDLVSKYLIDAPAAWKDVRVRHLLTHTSGIPEYTDRIDLRKSYTEDALLGMAFEGPLDSRPGERWDYCNTGYAVLGILESKVAGQFYGDFMKEHIFKPLQMNTARIINEADIIPNRAAGYHFVKGELKNQEWVAPEFNTTGDGSLYLTLDDMIKWDAALTAGKLISAKSFERMWTPVKTADGKDQGYGFGWSIGMENGHKRISHTGAWQGFSSAISRYPADQLTVIVFMNCAPAGPANAPGGRPGKLADDIAALFIPNLTVKP